MNEFFIRLTTGGRYMREDHGESDINVIRESRLDGSPGYCPADLFDGLVLINNAISESFQP